MCKIVQEVALPTNKYLALAASIFVLPWLHFLGRLAPRNAIGIASLFGHALCDLTLLWSKRIHSPLPTFTVDI